MEAAATHSGPINERLSAGNSISRMGWPAILAGGVVLAVAAAIGNNSASPAEFWHAYLTNFAFVASIAIGALFFTLASHLFGAYWSTSIRRLSEIVAGSMPYVALLFLPIAWIVMFSNTGSLYPWGYRAIMDPELDPVLGSKADYLSPNWFVLRAVVIFGVWLFATWFMSRGSLRVDQTGSVSTLRNLARWSGPLMVLFALSLNVAAFDWFMSLDPVWFSTMFGVYFWAGSVMSFLAVLMLLIGFLQSRGLITESIRVEQRHDIAKLMFAMVIFWGYVTFSQFMLIWYANVPEETKWFADRGALAPMGFSRMTTMLFVFHLLVPFLGFMSKRVRRNRAAMAFWSAYLLVVHWFDCYYIVMPTLKVTRSLTQLTEPGSASVPLLAGLCLIGMVLVLLGAIARGTGGKFLVPVRDPRMHQATTYVNH